MKLAQVQWPLVREVLCCLALLKSQVENQMHLNNSRRNLVFVRLLSSAGQPCVW